MEDTLTSSQNQSGITTKLWRNHLGKTTMVREKLYKSKQTEELASALTECTCTTTYKTWWAE